MGVLMFKNYFKSTTRSWEFLKLPLSLSYMFILLRAIHQMFIDEALKTTMGQLLLSQTGI
jgi:hypothetical protein